MTTAPLKVLVVDDSALFGEALTAAFEEDGRLHTVGIAPDGSRALEMVESLKPDVVVMDLMMPRVDGLEAVSSIMARRPTPILVLTGDPDRDLARLAFDALRRGALDLQRKPVLVGPDASERRALIDKLLLLASIPTVYHAAPRARRGEARTASHAGRSDLVVVGIASSTGGPSVVAELLAGLDPTVRAAVLVVQHMAGGFAAHFAAWLRSVTSLRVDVGAMGARLEAGRVFVAPDNAHLCLGSRETLLLDDTMEEVDGSRPSGTVLLQSIARRVGANSIGVVLTGMGQDGARGLADIAGAGGVCIVQDAQTSIVDGMPRAARQAVPMARVVERAGLASAVRAAVTRIQRGRVGPGSTSGEGEPL